MFEVLVACIENTKSTEYLFQKMLDSVFLTKQNMAWELGISYGKLARVWTSDHITKGIPEAMEYFVC